MEKLGRYEIVGELGRGGCGIVYRAVDPSIGRHVAIKTILTRSDDDATTSTDLLIRLRREAQSAGVLSHPNIVTVHELAEEGDLTYIVMEYVTGKTLKSVMAQEQLPDEGIISLLRQAADALDYAHARGVVHRDVKPANFILSDRGALKIADFGIAKVMNAESTALTQTGAMIGTLHYMAPEQIAMEPVTGRTDQFALAVIAYEMLTGQKPFQGDSAASILMQVLNMEPPPVEKHRASLGPPATQVLRRALAKNPDSRYPSCSEFVRDLEAAVGNEKRLAVTGAVIAPAPALLPRPAARSKAALLWLLAGLAVAAVGMQGYRMFGPQPPVKVAENVTPDAPPPAGSPEPAPVAPPVQQTPAPEPPRPEPARKEPPSRKTVEAAKAIALPKPETPAAAPPQPEAPVRPAVPAVEDPALPPGGKYRGPSDGSFVWTGMLRRDSRLVMAGPNVSSGSIVGRGLPVGVAVTVAVDQREVRVLENPSPGNRYRLVLSATADVRSLNLRWKEQPD